MKVKAYFLGKIRKNINLSSAEFIQREVTVLSETIYLFCFCTLFTNIYITVKLILQPKTGTTYAISIINWIFGKIVLVYFCL